ncbi:hypothetical protein XELAEV_18023441mg [Xenopus laevis]|uniref:Uncharacterized protein n=1 Tax=Xenopus laevis TaxID=8355 RepID=A0A974HPN7_XENLA|nr:hypothetical protein XELAEV_18023441mg [Xenopus laevis]
MAYLSPHDTMGLVQDLNCNKTCNNYATLHNEAVGLSCRSSCCDFPGGGTLLSLSLTLLKHNTSKGFYKAIIIKYHYSKAI